MFKIIYIKDVVIKEHSHKMVIEKQHILHMEEHVVQHEIVNINTYDAHAI
jgi:hypothetical protein